jgi:hypothetical protein
MNYGAFTKDSIAMMYAAARGAPVVSDFHSLGWSPGRFVVFLRDLFHQLDYLTSLFRVGDFYEGPNQSQGLQVFSLDGHSF